MNILITGGVGFIGTNCAIYFSKDKKNKVCVIDNFSREGVQKNAKFLQKNYPRIQIIKADINNIRIYKSILAKSDVVIHLAGQTAVTTSIKNPTLDFKSNLLGGFNLLEAVRKFNPEAILLYSSSNKVYGDLKNHQIKKIDKSKHYIDLCHPQGIDENEKLDFISPYGCSKGSTDLYFLDYARIYGLKTVVFRQSCIYGEFQIGVEDQGWVAHFTKQFLAKKPITIFGDGYQVRDLLYVNDLIQVYDSAIENINKVKGLAFNIGGGVKNAFSLVQTIEMIKKTLNKEVKISFKSPRLGDQKYFVSSNNKIKKYLDWQPKISFSAGLKKLINWQSRMF